jgi:hypothetical protein
MGGLAGGRGRPRVRLAPMVAPAANTGSRVALAVSRGLGAEVGVRRRDTGRSREPRARASSGARISAISLAALVTLSLAAGCTSGKEEGRPAPSATSKVETSSTWHGPPRAGKDGTIAVAGFNEHVERGGGQWTRSPLLLAINFLGLDGENAATTSIDLEASPEGGDEASMTVTLDGLLDDSVRGVRTALTLDRQADGSWRLRSARQEQRCWPNRGHREFSSALCL